MHETLNPKPNVQELTRMFYLINYPWQVIQIPKFFFLHLGSLERHWTDYYFCMWIQTKDPLIPYVNTKSNSIWGRLPVDWVFFRVQCNPNKPQQNSSVKILVAEFFKWFCFALLLHSLPQQSSVQYAAESSFKASTTTTTTTTTSIGLLKFAVDGYFSLSSFASFSHLFVAASSCCCRPHICHKQSFEAWWSRWSELQGRWWAL